MSYVRSTFLPRYFVLGSVLVFAGLSYTSVSQGEADLSCRPNNSMAPFDESSASDSFRKGQAAETGQHGFPKDPVKAYQWYCNSALQNDSAAQLKVGLMLLEGEGTKKDLKKGMLWLNRSASQGNHDAELALGILLVDSDALSSAKLFSRAAEGGNLYANHRLAELYYYGIGVPQSYEKAQELSALGSEAGFEKSKELLTRIRLKQESLPSSENQVSDAVVTQTAVPVIQANEEDVVIIPPEEQKTTVLQGLLEYLPSLKLRNTSQEAERVEITESGSDKELEPLAEESVVAIQPNETSVESVDESQLADQLVEAASQELEAMESSSVKESVEVAQASSPKAPSKKQSSVESVKSAEVEDLTSPATGNRDLVTSDSAQRRGSEWVNQQPDMRYSIQLVQAGSVDGILKFINKYSLRDKAYYIHALQDGQWRYILLYGDYPNNRTSKAVAKTLPQEIQDNGYWIRTYGDLRRSYTIAP